MGRLELGSDLVLALAHRLAALGDRRSQVAAEGAQCFGQVADTRSGVYRPTVSRTNRVTQNDSPNPKPIPIASQKSRLNIAFSPRRA